ncbi:N-formylglutamate amidohydrolase [Roseibium aggregatum]|uniref:N-formylglutamate amidohydrolase n=1 Tax=Roseibium aggregatum TaxID=187304 RepID=A0A939EJ61_9HYPH|nr:N-formylglutamate amidohydrolase [Roseibium aggregatum]MBN9672655.1 N-formylglutamate amidohydrolase [Roseibium aggregatum]
MILVEEGQSPLILCLPDSGTEMPDAVAKRLTATGKLQADLSWRLEGIFDFHKELDATVIRSSVSRYVIDVDKDPATPVSAAFDPTLALCPATTLDGKGIYRDGEEPGPTEIEQRELLFHAPFHAKLQKQINRLRARHRHVIVLVCQSIRSQIRGVTEKGLPLVNIGSGGGESCDPDLRNLIVGSFNAQQGFTVGVDGQAKGGYITRFYGRPEDGVHAMTVLLAQRSYLRHESPPFEPDKSRVARLQTVLSDSFSRIVDWAGMTGGDESCNPQREPENPKREKNGVAPSRKTTPLAKAGVGREEGASARARASEEEIQTLPVDPLTLPDLTRAKPARGRPGDYPVLPLQVAE